MKYIVTITDTIVYVLEAESAELAAIEAVKVSTSAPQRTNEEENYITAVHVEPRHGDGSPKLYTDADLDRLVDKVTY